MLSVIIFIIILWFVLPPLLRWGGKLVMRHAARRMTDKFMRDAGLDPDAVRREQRRRQADSDARSQGGWSQPVPVEKKIDPAVATDVKFSDITSKTPAPDIHAETARPVSAEPQIEDVSWEDIPD